MGGTSAAATLRDVAALAGVSIKTVSNVVNGREFVGAENARRVRAAVRELGYQPNLAARNLRTGRTGLIALAVPELKYDYFAELADAVLVAAKAHGQTVLIEPTGGDRATELGLLQRSGQPTVDGLLFSPLGMTQADAPALDVDFPIVLLGERIFDGPVDHVLMDNVGGARQATEHLLATGRRRIAVIGVSDEGRAGSAPLRIRGYTEALEAARVPFDDQLVVSYGGWHRKDGAGAAAELVRRGVDFDAVFALNDELALGALRVLHQERLDVPAQVSVVGFDNVADGEFSMPSLTTIDPHWSEIARKALAALNERIEDRDGALGGPRRISVPASLVERESAAESRHALRRP